MWFFKKKYPENKQKEKNSNVCEDVYAGPEDMGKNRPIECVYAGPEIMEARRPKIKTAKEDESDDTVIEE